MAGQTHLEPEMPTMIHQHVQDQWTAVEQHTRYYAAPSWKRIFDTICIIFASPFLMPLAMLIVLLVKIGSRGPALFAQERVGHHGRRFRCYKFRTMKVNSDQKLHREHTLKLIRSNGRLTKMDSIGDPRLIPLGSILRATGLDELPQIINVLKGEMSLVGPRPCLPYEFENYLPWQKQRFAALPGLTGLWQVSGKNRTTFNEMITLDIFYVEHQSLWMDLHILAKTVPVVINQALDGRDKGARPGLNRSSR